MKVTSHTETKLCHARPGDVVQLLDANLEPLPGIYVVSIFWTDDQKKPSKPGRALNGLYSVDDPLFLVNAETGEARMMPHLSSRVVIIRDAQLLLPGGADSGPLYLCLNAECGLRTSRPTRDMGRPLCPDCAMRMEVIT